MKLDKRLASASQVWLTVEEEALLENAAAMVERRDLENLQFWGKILGTEADYLILVGQLKLEEEQDYPNQTFFFCTNKKFLVKQLPESELHPQVPRDKRFTGVPSTELVAAVEPEEKGEDEDEGEAREGVPAYNEENLLGAVVREIHFNTAVVPRGAFVADPCHKVARNPSFSGLSVADATDINSYFHFRKPADLSRVRAADGMILPTDFLDAITSTHPTGSWSCQIDECDSIATLRSLIFPGYTFYHQPNSNCFGGVYIGNGSQNYDVAFML